MTSGKELDIEQGWPFHLMSLSVSLPSPLLLLLLSSEESPNISEASLTEFFAIAAIFLSVWVFSSDRESKDFALKWNRIEFIPNCLKWHGQSFVYWIDLCPIYFRVHVHSTCSPPIELVFFTSLVSCLYEAWLLYLMSGELRSLCHNHSRTPDIGNTFSFMMNIFVTVKVC